MKLTQKTKLFELGLLGIALIIYFWRFARLFSGKESFIGDNYVSVMPFLNYYADSLYKGNLPLWNPFSHLGEPLYLLWGHIRLFEPVTALVFLLGKFLPLRGAQLFNWNHLALTALFQVSTYLYLRKVSTSLWSKGALASWILFSSFTIAPFRQPGVLFVFLWIPVLLILLERLFFRKDYSWSNWLFLSVLFGLHFQSYWFSGICLVTFLFVTSLGLFHRPLLQDFLRQPGFKSRLALFVVLTGAMALPNLAVYLDSKDYIFPLRIPLEEFSNPSPSITKSKLILRYEDVADTGNFYDAQDFIRLVFPYKVGSRGSDVAGLLGMLACFFFWWGLLFGKHERKKQALFCTVAIGLLMLGPGGIIHQVLYWIFPPLWFMRHLSQLLLIFMLGYFYFCILGFDHFLKQFKPARLQPTVLIESSTLTAVLLIVGSPALHLQFGSKDLVKLTVVGLTLTGILVWKFFSRTSILVAVLVAHLISLPIHFGLHRSFLPYLLLAGVLPLGLASFLNVAALRGLVLLIAVASETLFISGQLKNWYSNPKVPSSLVLDSGSSVFQRREIISLGTHPPSLRGVLYPALYLKKPLLLDTETSGVASNPFQNWANDRIRITKYYLHRPFFTQLSKTFNMKDADQFFDLKAPMLTWRNASTPIKVLYTDPNNLILEVESVGSSLEWRDGYNRHWVASIDGASTPVLPFKEYFKQVSVPPGRHIIKFEYVPKFFLWSIRIFLALLYGVPALTLLLQSIRRQQVGLLKQDTTVA